MIEKTPHKSFVDQLQHALINLYDPVALLDNPLTAQVGAGGRDATGVLRQTLTAAIDALAPDASVPPHAPLAQAYQLLYQRFVEQFTQKEVAADLGLSVRQLRRREKRALQLLANRIAAQFGSPAAHELDVAPAEADQTTPSRRAELAWSQRTFADERVETADLLASVMAVAAPLLQSLGVRVEVDLPETLPRLLVEPVSVRQALLGLLATLAHARPPQPLYVRAAAQRDRVEIAIEHGHAAGALALDKGEAAENLRMAETLLDAVGGQLRVDGGGVRLLLPCEEQISVLVVEDNPDTLQLLTRYAANTRYQLVGVREATQAVARAVELIPDLIVLDVMLPEIDGWQLLGQLRAHPHLEGIPVIVCTILPQAALARSLGADAFLRKPVGHADFLAALDAQLPLLR